MKPLFIPILILAAMLGACAGKDSKKSYSISSTTLHRYQAGDYLDYSVVGDKLTADGNVTTVVGDIRVSWQAAALADGPNIGNQSLLKETTTISLTGIDQTKVRYIAQDEAGNLSVFAIQDSADTVAWTQNDLGSYGVQYLFSPLDAENPVLSGAGSLLRCPSGSCNETVGSISFDLIRNGTEKQSTPLAKFETYKISTRSVVNFESSDGVAWIFPPVGIVKFLASVLDTSGTRLEYTASLASTNIHLPEPDASS